MHDIDIIMQLINWDRSPSEQQKGILLARDVNCLKAFFQPSGPGYHKNVWENCAKIVCVRPDYELQPYILDMLLWIQDLNWPGAMAILYRLKEFSEAKVLAKLIESMLPALVAVEEYTWLENISELLENQSLKEVLSDSAARVLTDISMIISEC